MNYKYEMLPDECWWGGTSVDGEKMPFDKNTDITHDFRVKADNQTTDSVKIYTKLLNSPLPTNKADLKRLLNISSVEYFNVFSNYLFNSGQNVETLSRMLNEITENNEPYLIKHLSLNGNDLIELGYKGQEIGDILNRLLNSCIEQPELNTKENLIKLI